MSNLLVGCGSITDKLDEKVNQPMPMEDDARGYQTLTKRRISSLSGSL